MDRKLVFPSIAHPNLRYVYSQSYDWDAWRAQRGLDLYCTVYDTMGDGDTQHTPLRHVTLSEGPDFLKSLRRYLLNNASTFIEGGKEVPTFLLWNKLSPRMASFLYDLKPSKTGKKVWYSVRERKKTTRDMSNDRRYFELPPGLSDDDGPRMLWLLETDENHRAGSFLGRMAAFISISDWLEKNTESFPTSGLYTVFGDGTDLSSDLITDLWASLRETLSVVESIHHLYRAFDLEKRRAAEE